MWELDCEESWAPKNWCFWTVVLEKTLESPLDCKDIQPVHSKGNQSWVFFGRSDAKAETPILWPPHVKSWLIGKDSDAGRDWGQAGGEGDDRGWDGWMVSPTQWTWVCANSWSWWWTGRPGLLQFMGSQRVRHDWVIELNWTEPQTTGKESVCNLGDPTSIPGSRRSPGERHGNPLQYTSLENPYGQRSLAGYSPWNHKEFDMTEWLKWTELIGQYHWWT